MSQFIRSSLVLLFGGFLLVFAAQQLTEMPSYRVPKDFPEYWAAGRLNLHGQNPYDSSQLLMEQSRIDPDREEALMMWNPPPALVLYMPLDFIPYKLAGLVWVGVQLLAVMFACDLLWRQYYPQGNRWLAQLVGLTFVGTWWVVAFGQNSGLLLLGVAGFLHYSQKRKPFPSGAFAALTALKPHLLAGFGVLLLADVRSRKGRLTLLAGGGVIALSLVLAMLTNPPAVQQYLAATENPGPGAIRLCDWAVPVPAYWLRMTLAPDSFILQFVPCALSCLGILVWRLVAGDSWNLAKALPLVIAIAILTAPYGWIFDFTVLLVPVIWATTQLLAARNWPLLVAMLLVQFAVTIVSVSKVRGLHEYWWVPPAVLAPCLLAIFGNWKTTGSHCSIRSLHAIDKPL
jgi:hypothetical protein